MEKAVIEPELEDRSKYCRRLSWVELLMALSGFVIIYFVMSLGTHMLMKQWPYERLLMYLNAFMTQLAFILLIWGIKKIRHWEWSDFGWKRVPIKSFYAKVIKLYIMSLIINLCYAIVLFSYGFTPPETDAFSRLLEHVTWMTLLLNIFLAAVLAPIAEETLFRGVVFGSLRTYFGEWTAAVISASIFSGLHFQAYGFFPRFVLGMVLVYLYNRYKSIYPAVGLHALNNLIAIVASASLLN